MLLERWKPSGLYIDLPNCNADSRRKNKKVQQFYVFLPRAFDFFENGGKKQVYVVPTQSLDKLSAR